MRHYSIALILWLLVQPPTDPHLRARFDTPTSATVQWSQQQRACLYVTHQTGAQAFVGCWEGAGAVTVELGHEGPLSGDVRPAIGDVYRASIDGATYRAPLKWWRYLAVWRA